MKMERKSRREWTRLATANNKRIFLPDKNCIETSLLFWSRVPCLQRRRQSLRKDFSQSLSRRTVFGAVVSSGKLLTSGCSVFAKWSELTTYLRQEALFYKCLCTCLWEYMKGWHTSSLISCKKRVLHWSCCANKTWIAKMIWWLWKNSWYSNALTCQCHLLYV